MKKPFQTSPASLITITISMIAAQCCYFNLFVTLLNFYTRSVLSCLRYVLYKRNNLYIKFLAVYHWVVKRIMFIPLSHQNENQSEYGNRDNILSNLHNNRKQIKRVPVKYLYRPIVYKIGRRDTTKTDLIEAI